jgi:uncharacterized protein YukE
LHSNGFNLRANGLVQVQVTTQVSNRFGEKNRYEKADDTLPVINMTSQVAMLTDSWASTSENYFDDKVDGWVVNQAVECMASPMATLMRAIGLAEHQPPAGEVVNADTVPAANESTILPNSLKQ